MRELGADQADECPGPVLRLQAMATDARDRNVVGGAVGPVSLVHELVGGAVLEHQEAADAWDGMGCMDFPARRAGAKGRFESDFADRESRPRVFRFRDIAF